MKKWIAALLSAGMVICCVIVPVRAETEEKARKSPVLESALVAPELEKKPVYDNRGAASAALTGDAVTFDAENGTFEVVTAAGTQMTVSVPFGAYCITQDVFQQLDIYMSLYSDVGAALKYYVGNGIHMDIFDFYTGSSTYISESEDPLASLIGEMNPLDETKLKSVADYMSNGMYEQERPFSVEEQDVLNKLLHDLAVESLSTKDISDMKRRLTGFLQGKVYSHTQFVIEEPEQNLYPQEQYKLVEYLTSIINHRKQHRLTLTTHSPYIINFLNVLLRRTEGSKSYVSHENLNVYLISDGHLTDMMMHNKAMTKWAVDTSVLNAAMEEIVDEFERLA